MLWPQDGNDVPRFRLLFVCTGNICRSPFAEIFTRHQLIGRLGGRAAGTFHISSAGVSAVVGAPVHPHTTRELAVWGLQRAAQEFAARQLSPAMVEEADLVLGVTPWHRSAVIEKVPDAMSTTFGLREFAWLANSVDPAQLPRPSVARAHALVDLARRQRGRLPPRPRQDYDVPDPMGHSRRSHHRAASLIGDATQMIVDLVAPRLPAVSRQAPEPDRR